MMDFEFWIWRCWIILKRVMERILGPFFNRRFHGLKRTSA